MKQVPAIFPQICKQNGLPEPEPEVRFHATRRWRFDWGWKDQRVALEIDGGVWSGGAHGRGTGIVRDQEKHNYAACMGWIVIRCVPRDLHSAATFAFRKEARKVNAARRITPEYVGGEDIRPFFEKPLP